MRNHSGVFLMLTRTINVKQLKSVENADSTRSRPHLVCRRLHQGQLRETVPTSTRDSKMSTNHVLPTSIYLEFGGLGEPQRFECHIYPRNHDKVGSLPRMKSFQNQGSAYLTEATPPKAMPVETVKRLQDVVARITIHLKDHFI